MKSASTGPAKKIFVFPASFAQRSLWFLDQVAPGDVAYSLPMAMRIRGPLDIGVLERSLLEIVNRHESIRTRFVEIGGEPQQVIEDPVKLEFPQIDLSILTEEQRHSEMQRLLREAAERPFDLGRAPMLRTALLTCGERDHVLILNVHHIVHDQWSRWVFLRELSSLYEAFSAGKPSPLPALPIQYADFSEWQRQCLKDEMLDERLAYWKQQLEGVAVLDLPVSRTRATTITNRGARVMFDVPSEIAEGLKELCRRESVTLYMLSLACFQTLLYRYTGQDDISVGSPIAGRTRPETESLIGFFANTLVMRAKLSGELSFAEALRQTKETALAAYSHQEVPFEKLVEVISPLRAVNQTPLFQVAFVLQNTPPPALDLGSAKVERLALYTGKTKFDLTWQMEELANGLRGAVEYKTDLFDATTIARMIGHYRRLLAGVVADPHQSLDSLPLMDEREKIEVLEEFNQRTMPVQLSHLPLNGEATLHSLFEAQVVRRPNAIALTCGTESLSYAELNAQANRLAHRLIHCGVKPDTLVGLCLNRSNELVVALLAILKAGGAYLPIDLAYPAERLAFMLEDAQAPILLTHTDLVRKLPSVTAKVLCVDRLFAEPARIEDEMNLTTEVHPDHLAYVIYTSGTTGKPKGSLVTHRNVARLFPATEGWYGFHERDVWTLFHSVAFDFSVWEIWGALLYGGRLVVVPYMVSRSPESFYALLADEQVTVLNQTPSAFQQLMQVEESVGSKQLALRYVIFGGEALEIESLRNWFQRHGDQMPRLINMYGITETTVHVTYRPLSKDDLNGGSVIGTPLPDLRIYILDKQAQPVPVGIPGEIYVGGMGLSRGYLRRPELTAERFVPDHISGNVESRLYRTGDRARFLPGGDIEYLGRIDQQVKIRGFRIELGEIESVLCKHPEIREATVIVREDMPGYKRLVAYVIPSHKEYDPADLREELRKKLPDYMVPSAFVSLDRFPLTASGKVDLRALPIPASQTTEIKGLPPQTKAEKMVAEIWQGLLGLDQVGVEDNFFDLGGTSLLIVQLHRRLRDLFRTEFSVVTLFEHPTVRSQALELSQPASLTGQNDRERKDRAEQQRRAFQRSRPVFKVK